jgi:predicted Fe-Mo cluster-binding NifX family protein
MNESNRLRKGFSHPVQKELMMKVCIPIDLPSGEESIISSSFELAEQYLLYDSDLETFEIVGEQQNPKERDFTGHPLSRLLPGGAEVIITHSLRITSFVVLKQCGIKILKAQSQIACLNIGLLKSGKLREFSILDHVQGKTCGSSCSGCPKACGSQGGID